MSHLIGPQGDVKDDGIADSINGLHRRTNILLNNFGKTDSFVKDKLLTYYCTSLYGTQLWELPSRDVNNVLRLVEWHKCVRGTCVAVLSRGFCGSCPPCTVAPFVPYVRPGRFLRRLSENRGCSPRPTGIPTTRAFYGGGSVSLRVSHPKCGSFSPLGYSVSPSFLSLASSLEPRSLAALTFSHLITPKRNQITSRIGHTLSGYKSICFLQPERLAD